MSDSNIVTPHLSHSQLGDFTRCGKSFQLKRMQHAPQMPAVWLVGGKAVHLAIERVNKDLYERQVENG